MVHLPVRRSSEILFRCFDRVTCSDASSSASVVPRTTRCLLKKKSLSIPSRGRKFEERAISLSTVAFRGMSLVGAARKTRPEIGSKPENTMENLAKFTKSRLFKRKTAFFDNMVDSLRIFRSIKRL